MTEQKTIQLTGQQIVNALTQEKSRLESVQRSIASIQGLMEEIFFAKEALKEVKKTKKGDQAMVSLGVGVFLQVKIDEKTKVKTSLPGNVIIESKTDDAIAQLEEKEKDAQEKLEELSKQQQAIYANMNALSQIVQKAQQARKEQ